MGALTGTQIKATYGDVLQMGNAGGGLTLVLQAVSDGLGNASTFQLSTVACTLPSSTNGATGADWIFNGPSGHDIIFQIAGVEQGRFSHGNNFTASLGIRNNGVSFEGTTTNSLGGSNVNNLAATARPCQRWTASAPINVTGMVAGNDGERREIWNVGTNTITLTNQDVSSSAANQWLTTTGANIALAANKCALSRYDLTTAAWRVSLLP